MEIELEVYDDVNNRWLRCGGPFEERVEIIINAICEECKRTFPFRLKVTDRETEFYGVNYIYLEGKHGND